MKHLIELSKMAAIALSVACITLPAAAFDGVGGFQSGGNGPDEPGPGDGGPGGLASPGGDPTPPGGGGGGGGGGGEVGGGGFPNLTRTSPQCPDGRMITGYRIDGNGVRIANSYGRYCVPLR